MKAPIHVSLIHLGIESLFTLIRHQLIVRAVFNQHDRVRIIEIITNFNWRPMSTKLSRIRIFPGLQQTVKGDNSAQVESCSNAFKNRHPAEAVTDRSRCNLIVDAEIL